MTAKRVFESHRNALALIAAGKTGDEEGAAAVLRMVEEEDVPRFLDGLAHLVYVAFLCRPEQGWDAFTAGVAASLDQAEAQWESEQDPKNRT